MTGESGEALELALGLLRAPGLRSALRRRALPAGISEVLTIASGPSESTREASARTGRPEAELVEASRFYIQQVLLADDADAYRNLGAAPDAHHDLLRDHHRLLLRWLHPDRSSDNAQWDSALSSRVNQAWNRIRTPAVRARYDAERPQPGALDSTRVAATTAALARPLPYVDAGPGKPAHTGPIAVAFLAVACLALAWLAVTREQRLDEMRDASRFQSQSVDVSQRMAAPLPLVLPEVDVRAPAPTDTRLSGAPAPADGQQAAFAPEEPPQGVDPLGDRPAAETWGEAQPARIEREHAASAGSMSASASSEARETSLTAHREPARIEDPLQLFREAEDALEGVTRWLATGQGSEPFWLDLPVSLAGSGIRNDLHFRHAASTRNQLAILHPNWTLGAASASMSGTYRLDGRSGTLETGVLRVQLARRDERWRVAGLYMEPAQ